MGSTRSQHRGRGDRWHRDSEVQERATSFLGTRGSAEKLESRVVRGTSPSGGIQEGFLEEVVQEDRESEEPVGADLGG